MADSRRSDSSQFEKQAFICGAQEIDHYRQKGITHLVSIANPGASASKPSWFHGSHLQLWFGDVFSEADARQCRTKAPTLDDIREALAFFRQAWVSSASKILFSCDYGASRSPALAYVCMAEQLGPAKEQEAFDTMMKIRPDAVPNGLVIRLGDKELDRGEALLKPLRELHAKINRELSKQP